MINDWYAEVKENNERNHTSLYESIDEYELIRGEHQSDNGTFLEEASTNGQTGGIHQRESESNGKRTSQKSNGNSEVGYSLKDRQGNTLSAEEYKDFPLAEALFRNALASIGVESYNQRTSLAQYRADKKEYNSLSEDKREAWLKEKGYKVEDFADDVLDNGEEIDNSSEISYSKKATRYISYDKIGEDNVRAIRRNLFKLYEGIDNTIADNLALEVGDVVYVVDSGKDEGKITFGVREKYIIDNEQLRKEFIRRENENAIRKGYIDNGLSRKLGIEYADDRTRNRRQELGKELSTNQGKSDNKQGRVFDENANRGSGRLRHSLKESKRNNLSIEQSSNKDIRFSLKGFKESLSTTEHLKLEAIDDKSFEAIYADIEDFYSGIEEGYANGIAIECGENVYVFDSVKQHDEIYLGLVEIKRIPDKKKRIKTVQNYNYQAIINRSLTRELMLNFEDGMIDGVIRLENEIAVALSEGKAKSKRVKSSSEKDSSGRTLTKEQQEFFKYSKARDKNGNLEVVYHGTEGEFYTYDKELRGSMTGAQEARFGFFFTNSKRIATEYAVQAQDNKLFSMMYEIAKGDKEKLAKLRQVAEAMKLTGGEDVENYKKLLQKSENYELDIQELYLNMENPLIKDWEGKQYKKGKMLRTVINAVLKGHDGVIIRNIDDGIDYEGNISDTFVVFEPNQIKLTTNKTPTKSEDIRFSLKGRYTESQYNNFGWVRENEVLTTTQWDDFNKKYAQLKNQQAKFFRTSNSEYIVPVNNRIGEEFGVNNTLVYAKGSYDNPKISKIVKILLDNETSIDIVRNKIYESEGIIDTDYFDELVEVYHAETFQQSQQRGRGGENSFYYKGEQNGRRSFAETQGNLKFSRKPSSIYTLSDGQVKKKLADYTRLKVYSKTEVR